MDDGLYYKRGDRVPAGGTFTYRWSTRGWESTTGVWLYHDHSVMDHDNVLMGAIGMIVIHDPNDPNDVFVDVDFDREEALKHLPNRSLNDVPILGGRYVPRQHAPNTYSSITSSTAVVWRSMDGSISGTRRP